MKNEELVNKEGGSGCRRRERVTRRERVKNDECAKKEGRSG